MTLNQFESSQTVLVTVWVVVVLLLVVNFLPITFKI